MQLQTPTQSTTETLHSCATATCSASSAIDGDFGTYSITTHEKDPWWQAEFLKSVRIDHIMIYTQAWALEENFFDRYYLITLG